MTNFVIEKFKKTDLFIIATITCAFCQEYNDVLYLKHRTFYKLLSKQSQQILDLWFKRYKLDITSTNDPLAFVNYLCLLKDTTEFNLICSEVEDITKNLILSSKINGQLDENIRYVVKCYYREDDNTTIYSIFNETVLSALAQINVNFTDLRNTEIVSKTLEYLKQKDNYDYKSVQDCIAKVSCYEDTLSKYANSALLALMLYIVLSAYKTKPRRLVWSDIINQLYGESTLYDQEVFDLCYL